MTRRVLVTTLGDHDRHETGRGHPEQRSRIDAVVHGVEDAGLGEDVTWTTGRIAGRGELVHVHDAAYLDAVEQFAAAGGGDLDPDTPVSAGSFDTALLAAGSGLTAIDALRRGEASTAFVAVRPPGHHATRARGQGFCLLNNIAVAAAELTGTTSAC